MVYKIIKWWASFVYPYFFFRPEVNGCDHIPSGPFILVANHQNSFVDSIIAGVLLPSRLHYLARSDVFYGLFGKLLRVIQMMPVYRLRNGFKNLSKNEDTFQQCNDLLKEGRAVMVFPEANMTYDYFLRPLSKGTSRLAVNVWQDGVESLKILPLALNYTNHKKSRCKLYANFGEPLALSDYRELYDQNPVRCINQLRDDMSVAIKKLMFIPEKTEHYEQQSAVVRSLQHKDLNYLEAFQLVQDGMIDNNIQSRNLWCGLFDLINFPIYFLTKWILARMPDDQFILSIKYVVSMTLLPLYWLSLVLLVVSIFV